MKVVSDLLTPTGWFFIFIGACFLSSCGGSISRHAKKGK